MKRRVFTKMSYETKRLVKGFILILAILLVFQILLDFHDRRNNPKSIDIKGKGTHPFIFNGTNFPQNKQAGTHRISDTNRMFQGNDEIFLKIKSSKQKECHIPPMNSVDAFYDYIKKEQIICKHLEKFGGRKAIDGSKFVCLDQQFEIIPHQCMVLSFGIAKNWIFDDAMDNYGCTVHSFDPTIGLSDFNRSENIHFHNLGISDFDGQLRLKKDQISEVRRYETILRGLGLENTTIDYLKIDVEQSEIPFVEDVIRTSPHLMKNVRQIGMEIHPGNAPNTENVYLLKFSHLYAVWKTLHQLGCLGFKIAMHEMNRVKTNLYKFNNRIESCCYEMLFVNTNKAFRNS